MKSINTRGVTYLERLEGTEKWYWGSDYIHGDLYEAEEIFNNCGKIKSNNLLFVSYPEGNVIEPIKPHDGQYFGTPIYCDKSIIILLVDFNEKLIKIKQYEEINSEVTNIASIPLNEIKNCHNLILITYPLMLTRQSHEDNIEIIYPNKRQFKIEDNEDLYFRKDNYLYFSQWFENEDIEYGKRTIIRDFNTGEIVKKKDSSLMIMPDGQVWYLN